MTVIQGSTTLKNASIGPFIIRNGLIIHFDAQDRKSYSGSGTIWYNLIEGDNHGTLVNSPTFSLSNKGTLGFASASSQLINTSFTYTGENRELTMGVWMKAPAVAQRCGLFGFRSAYNASVAMSQNQLYITGDQYAGSAGTGCSFDDWRRESDGTFSSFRSVYALNTPVCDGEWHNIIIVRAIEATRLYIDGQLIDENSDGTITNVTSDNVFKLGVAGNSAGNLGGYYFNGNIAVNYFYNIALSGEQVLENFNAIKGRFILTETPCHEIQTTTTSTTTTTTTTTTSTTTTTTTTTTTGSPTSTTTSTTTYAPGFYCVNDGETTYCIDSSENNPQGFTVVGGPYATLEECQGVCSGTSTTTTGSPTSTTTGSPTSTTTSSP